MFVEHDQGHEHRVGDYAQADQCQRDGRLRLALRMALERPTPVGHGPVGSRITEVRRADHHHGYTCNSHQSSTTALQTHFFTNHEHFIKKTATDKIFIRSDSRVGGGWLFSNPGTCTSNVSRRQVMLGYVWRLVRLAALVFWYFGNS